MKQPIREKVRGVNLGNWLVLEKWMDPAMFAGTEAEDEYYLARDLPPAVYRARMELHRSEYITERDFAIIASWGLNTVRIPVPFYLFGDRPPYIGCIEYLDKAFAWAKKYGLRILVDLHTAPYSQNGSDNGGICGVCKWSQMPQEVDFELFVLERLAQRYGRDEALWGIEILNEPMLEDTFGAGMQERYKPRDAVLAAGSRGMSAAFLRDYYVRAYERIRRYAPEDKYIVLHDAFHLTSWKDFMQEEQYRGVVLDTHLYFTMLEFLIGDKTLANYIEGIRKYFTPQIQEMEKYFPVIVGEWCLFTSNITGVDTKGGQVVSDDAAPEKETWSAEEKRSFYSAIGRAALDSFANGSGWFYWSYKLLLDTVNEHKWIGWDSWDFGKSRALGWFPLEESHE